MIIKDSQVVLSNERQFNNTNTVIDAQESISTQAQDSTQNGNRRTTLSELNIEHTLKEHSTQSKKLDNYSTVFQADGTIVSLSNHQRHQDAAASLESTIYSRRMFQQMRLQPTAVLQSGTNNSQEILPVNVNLIASNGVGFNSNDFSVSQIHQSSEHEALAFSALGGVTLEDGTRIEFNFNQTFERNYLKEESINITQQEVNFIDPLVITYDTDATSVLSNELFEFDMNNDGQKEHLTFTANGSGFLVLDKNSDGEINHGGEVFGGVSGNGFSELAQYDSDGNQWIDENDAVYSQLQIWTQTSTNEKELISLKDAGVGAIYLNASAGEYTFTDHHNTAQGKVQQSGIFLKENGEVGSVMQIDLAVQAAPETDTETTQNIAQSSLSLADGLTQPQFTNNLPTTPSNKVSEENIIPDWFTFEDELKALNKFIDRLSSGEANLADIGLFLSSGITNQVTTNNLNANNLNTNQSSVPSFSSQIWSFSELQPFSLNVKDINKDFINVFNLQSPLGTQINRQI